MIGENPGGIRRTGVLIKVNVPGEEHDVAAFSSVNAVVSAGNPLTVPAVHIEATGKGDWLSALLAKVAPCNIGDAQA